MLLQTAQRIERRAHERFQVSRHAFALVRPAGSEPLCIANKSMGEIACLVYRSKPAKYGRINDLSEGGLSFRYIAGTEQSCQPFVLDILSADCGLYLKDFTFDIIHDLALFDHFSTPPLITKVLRVQFTDLPSSRISELTHFIQNYCAI